MFKVQILIPCVHCKGQAYIFDRKAIAYDGKPYDQDKQCPACNGSGIQANWIDFSCFLKLLEEAHALDKRSRFTWD